MKNKENTNEIAIVVLLWLIATGAANQTQIIAKAKTEIICHKVLFHTKSKDFVISNLVKYSKNIFKAKNHTIQNHKIANGNKYSTIFHKLGTNKAHKIKQTLIVIAKVKGTAIKVTSLFHFFNFSKSFVFLYFKSLLYRKSDFNNILEIIEA